jgi:hypothetical protein
MVISVKNTRIVDIMAAIDISTCEVFSLMYWLQKITYRGAIIIIRITNNESLGFKNH